MQDNWQEFDRQFKSVLQDAGEKAPRRVWRAVSARLDSAASAALWWRWAVPAFVAAALVAGPFLSGTFGNIGSKDGDINIVAQTEIVSSDSIADDALASLTDTEASELSEAPVSPVTRRHASIDSKHFSGTEDADFSPATEQIKHEPAALEGNEAAAQEERQGAGEAIDESDTAAQWARIVQEENQHKSEGFKLRNMYAQGSVGGNDSNISYGGNGISRMAPGAGSENAGISEAGQSTYGVPFTMGVGVRFGLTDKLSIGTGLDYSLLTRTFKGAYSGSAAAAYEGQIAHTLQYIGVPVNVYYDLYQTRDELIRIYAWGGGEAEYCLSNRYRLMNTANTVIPDKAGGFQFSAATGLGMEFKISDVLGLYADPSVRYYFHGDQPKSVRTDKPFMFNFDAGLRFNF